MGLECRNRVKAKMNGGDVLLATDPRGDVEKRAVSENEVKIYSI